LGRQKYRLKLAVLLQHYKNSMYNMVYHTFERYCTSLSMTVVDFDTLHFF
jgi:hypothetical protein